MIKLELKSLKRIRKKKFLKNEICSMELLLKMQSDLHLSKVNL